jgi:hypothetical protein
MKSLLTVAALLHLLPGVTCLSPMVQTYLPTLSANSTVQYTSFANNTGADGPKVHPISNGTYDWWYFDAVSSDGTEAVTVVFYAASASGFIDAASEKDILNVQILGTLANGTTLGAYVGATEAVVTTVGNSATGNWVESGCNFTGAHDLSGYEVTVNNPDLGISGTMKLKSVRPADIDCLKDSLILDSKDLDIIRAVRLLVARMRH